MSHLLSFDLTSGPVPGRVTDLVDYLESRAVRMGACRDARGGIRRAEVASVVERELLAADFSGGVGGAFAAKELDFTHTSGVALSIQAGRAAANHGALFAVLAAAASPPVDWLVLAVPVIYKGVTVIEPVLRELDDLRSSPGIRLDLQGVQVVDY